MKGPAFKEIMKDLKDRGTESGWFWFSTLPVFVQFIETDEQAKEFKEWRDANPPARVGAWG